MRTLATKQPTNDSAKQKKKGNKRQLSRSVSPVSTGMPLLQRKCACGGGCPHCQEELGIQTKLKIGEPGDKYEQEADRVSDQVMRMPETSIQRQVEPEEEEEMVQWKDASGQTPTVTPGIAARLEAIRGGGEPLSDSVRSFMESRFGVDFSEVRVYTGNEVAQLNQILNAQAFTHRQNVYFRTGKYNPDSHEGQRLLAHELTHVVQQNVSRSTDLIQRDLVYGSGYRNPYQNERAEIRSASRKTWTPSSDDFQATAQSSGGGEGVDSFDSLLDLISQKAVGSITELGLIGHANVDRFGLSGRIIIAAPADVIFSPAGLINEVTINNHRERIEVIRDRFSADAKIVLYGCNAGSRKSFLDTLSNAFGVCVHGFQDEITVCLGWERIRGKRTISSRGRVYTPDFNQPLPEMNPPSGKNNCQLFFENIRSLVPSLKSCPPSELSFEPDVISKSSVSQRSRLLGLELRVGQSLLEEQRNAALSLGVRFSLRPGRAIVINPILGAHLLYLSPGSDSTTQLAAAIAEIGVRVQQPLRGFYFDVRGGGYVGLKFRTPETLLGKGITASLGGGYRLERIELGAEIREIFGTDRLLVLGVGAFRF